MCIITQASALMNKCTLSLHKNVSWFTSEHYEGIPCSDLQQVGRWEKEISWQPMVRTICAHSGTNMKIVHLVSREKCLHNNSGGCVSQGSVSRLKVNPGRAQQNTRQKVRVALTEAVEELWMKAHYEKRLDKNSLHPQAFIWRQAQNKMQETLTEKPLLHVKLREHSSCKIKDSSTNGTLDWLLYLKVGACAVWAAIHLLPPLLKHTHSLNTEYCVMHLHLLRSHMSHAKTCPDRRNEHALELYANQTATIGKTSSLEKAADVIRRFHMF